MVSDYEMAIKTMKGEELARLVGECNADREVVSKTRVHCIRIRRDLGLL